MCTEQAVVRAKCRFKVVIPGCSCSLKPEDGKLVELQPSHRALEFVAHFAICSDRYKYSIFHCPRVVEFCIEKSIYEVLGGPECEVAPSP